MTNIESSLHLYQPPMYHANDNTWHNHFEEAIKHTSKNLTWDVSSILSMLSFNYVCGDRTLINEIKRQSWLSYIESSGNLKLEKIPKHNTLFKSPIQIAQDLYYLLEDEIVKVCKNYNKIYLLLSGGMDSRIVAGITVKAFKKGKINSNIKAITWGLDVSRDVFYARKVANILGIELLHIDISPKNIFKNIDLSATRLANLISGKHLHEMPWLKNLSKDSLVLAGSYGDSIGRAEYSGKHILERNLLKPQNKYELIKSDIYDFAYKSLNSDLKGLHSRNPRQPKYVLCEYERQAHYMRGMIAHAMSIINDYCKVYQVFTDPKVYSYIWSIHPSLRNDAVYTKLLGKLNNQLLILPWARTNRSINGKKKGANLYLQKEYHKYNEWIGGQLFEELFNRLDIKLLNETGIFKVESIEKICRDIKRNTAFNKAYEIFIWLIGFSQFSKWLNNMGKTVEIDPQNITKEIKLEYNRIQKFKQSVKIKIKKFYLKHKYLVNSVKYIRKLKKKKIFLIALIKYPPRRN